jgi:apolipoprotein N-acyltransferase
VAIAQKLEVAMQAALAIEPDYILLPEDARYFNQVGSTQLVRSQFGFRTGSPEVVIVDSGGVMIDSQLVLQSFVYNYQSSTVDQSQKRYLVPQGEFMPTLYTLGLRLFGQGELVDRVSQELAYDVGPDISQADHAPSSPGILFCFESVSPWGVRTIIHERGSVPFVAHPVSHAWFNEPQVLWNQLERMLRVQAIWNQQYIVSAGNHVAGYLVTPTGAIVYPEPVAQGEYWQVGVVTVPN